MSFQNKENLQLQATEQYVSILLNDRKALLNEIHQELDWLRATISETILKKLESEISSLKQQRDQLKDELNQKDRRISILNQELAVLKNNININSISKSSKSNYIFKDGMNICREKLKEIIRIEQSKGYIYMNCPRCEVTCRLHKLIGHYDNSCKSKKR